MTMENFCSACGKPVEKNANYCTHCGASLSGKAPAKTEWQQKREKVLGKQRGGSKRMRSLLWVVGLSVLVGWVYFNTPERGNPIIKALPVVTNAENYGPSAKQMSAIGATVENGSIVLSLDLLKEKKLIRFVYGDSSSGLPLLAYISGEGKVITAVSMCEPCNSTMFHIQGDKIICNSCGTTWELNTLEAVSGSCGRFPPDALPNTVVGNKVHINEQLVARWQRRA